MCQDRRAGCSALAGNFGARAEALCRQPCSWRQISQPKVTHTNLYLPPAGPCYMLPVPAPGAACEPARRRAVARAHPGGAGAPQLRAPVLSTAMRSLQLHPTYCAACQQNSTRPPLASRPAPTPAGGGAEGAVRERRDCHQPRQFPAAGCPGRQPAAGAEPAGAAGKGAGRGGRGRAILKVGPACGGSASLHSGS